VPYLYSVYFVLKYGANIWQGNDCNKFYHSFFSTIPKLFIFYFEFSGGCTFLVENSYFLKFSL